MAQSNYTACSDNLDPGNVARGVSAGFTTPSGGGSFCYSMNSLSATPGAVCFFNNYAGFTPMDKGGRVSGCLLRGSSAGRQNFSPFLFIGLQGTTNLDTAYILGLSDDDPSLVSLVKGRLVDGVPSAVPGTLGVLRRSAVTADVDKWQQLRLDMIVNPGGDTILRAYRSELYPGSGLSPVWTELFPYFVDDVTGVNSGSAPLANGRQGFGAAFKDVSRRVRFDLLQHQKQT